MAITTSTASTAQAGVVPRTGVNYTMNVAGVYVSSAQTLSDIILLAKLPDRAVVTKITGYIKGAEALAQIKLGLSGGGSASETAFGTHTASASTVGSIDTFAKGIAPVQVSFSDDAEPRVAYVYATLSAGSFTTSFSIAYNVEFNTP